MSAPDRIWAWPEHGAEDCLIYACEKDELEFACEKYGLVPAGTFLASTPAREHADELVEAFASLPDKIEIYRAIKKSGARKHGDIAGVIEAMLEPFRQIPENLDQ